MKAFRDCLFGIVALGAALLAGCSPSSTPLPQAGVSESQAKTDIEYRLSKTQQVRVQIGHLRDEIRPLGDILRDLGKAVDVRVDQHPGNLFAGLLNRLNEVLQGAVSGVVETHADGSWLLEHPSPLCAHARVRLTGHPEPGGERFEVALSNCAHPDTYESLVTVLVATDGSRLITISSATFENLQNQSVSFDPCTMSVDTANNLTLVCSSFALASEGRVVSFDRLEYRTDSQGTHVAIHAGLGDEGRGSTETVSLLIEPGLAPSIAVCTGDRSCAP